MAMLAASSPTVSPPYPRQNYSGLAQAGSTQHLVVHDSKCPGEVRVSAYNAIEGQVEVVDMDWRLTGQPEDLEAVAGIDGSQDQYLAVEGSRYQGRTPQLFLFDYADGNGRSLKRFDLPRLPYEIEGMVTSRRSDGDVLVVLGGRGGEASGQGRLHWGVYDPEEQELEWSPDGRAGLAIALPERLGPNERPISDLHLNQHGELWAAGCVDNGDHGPFESMVYRLGKLDTEARAPVTLTIDQPIRIRGEKVEALASNQPNGQRLLIGTDNEACGGTLQSLLSIPYNV